MVVKTAFYLCRDVFRGFFTLPSFPKRLSGRWAKTLWTLGESMLPWGTNWFLRDKRNNVRKLSALEKDLSKTFVKKLSTVYSKCILRVQRIIAMRILLLAGMSNSFLRGRTNFSNFFRKSFHSQSCFRNLSINIADSYQKVFGSFVKLHSTCQEKNFEVFFLLEDL